jgi:ATP-dependent exoDNAse (exonuclease V) alpha subunit
MLSSTQPLNMHELKEVMMSTPVKATMDTTAVTALLERLEAPLAALLASAAKDSKPVRDLERAILEAKVAILSKEKEALQEENKNLRALNTCLQANRDSLLSDCWRPRLATPSSALRAGALAALLRAGAPGAPAADETPLAAACAAADERPAERACALLRALWATGSKEDEAVAPPQQADIPPPPFPPATQEGTVDDEDLYS